jgi:DNA processing protein
VDRIGEYSARARSFLIVSVFRWPCIENGIRRRTAPDEAPFCVHGRSLQAPHEAICLDRVSEPVPAEAAIDDSKIDTERETVQDERGQGEGSLEQSTGAEWLALQRAFVGHPEVCAAALAQGGSPRTILARSGRARPDGRTRAERDFAVLEKLGGKIVAWGQAGYPPALSAISDPPPVLLVAGRPEVLARPSIAIVGARAATRGARERARRLARDLAERGLTIVSGLARGIDAEAHRGALEGGGVTVAVLACGIDRIYPPEHRALAEQIREQGAIVGEMPIGTPPRRELFPLRNRVISGLARGVLVVEARRRSGSLITVRHALDQGREVFVVPGSVDGPFAEGSNRLLREGARAVWEAETLFADLEFDDPDLRFRLVDLASASLAEQRSVGAGQRTAPSADAGVRESRTEVHEGRLEQVCRRVLEVLSDGAADREMLCGVVATDAGLLAAALLDLLLAGRIAEERNGFFHRVDGHPPVRDDPVG